MKKTRDGLHGNFISLRRAVEAVASHIAVTDAEVESLRALNRALGPDDFGAMIERLIIRNVICQARAARILLQKLNQPAGSRPKWFDATKGFPILDDSVGRQGLDALVPWSGSEVTLIVTGGPRNLPPMTQPIPELMGRPSRSMQIGFDVDELIAFLDANGIPHNLGKPLTSELTNEAAQMVAKPVSEPAAASPCSIVHFNDFDRPGKKCPIEPEIIEAQSLCVDRHRKEEVMLRLLDMAAKQHPVLRVKNGCLHYVDVSDGKLKQYEMNALRQFISPANEAKREAARLKRRAAVEGASQASKGKAVPAA